MHKGQYADMRKGCRAGWIAGAAALSLLLSGCVAPSGPTEPARDSGLPTCGKLPDQAPDTIEAIEHGGPYKYPANDDQRFGNYEGLLPKEPREFYREYTVDTPGINHRGARRIITGGEGPVRQWYYTADHYESFCEIVR